jgi:hypothetical protein
MNSYTVRIELHDAQFSHYETLHAEMAKRGFSRTITSDDGTTYHLPWAEYNYFGSEDRQGVLHLAKAAARTTGKSSAVLVTQSAGRSWDGLTQVR